MHSKLENELEIEKFIWIIENFNRIPQKAGIPFKSSIIHQRHPRKVWRFFLYPSSISDQNYVAAYFARAYRMFDPLIYNSSMSIGGSYSNPAKSFELSSADFSIASIGGDKCLRRDSIEKLRKGSVTVQCEISEVSQKGFLLSKMADFENLAEDLVFLYENPVFCDLIVYIQQFKFFLHTCVLYARARRLIHFFGFQSFNEIPKIVQIDNIPPHLFEQLMFYLYSGRLEGSNFPFELFTYADKLKIQSFKQRVYEKVQEHRTHTDIATQTITITWNLKEIQLREKDSVPFVQIFRTSCCMTHLVVRMGTSADSDGEKYIDVSFKVFMDTTYKPVSLLCILTLLSKGKCLAYKKDSYNIEPDEEWHFPPFVKLNEIPQNNENYGPCIYLMAEVSLSDGCTAYHNLHTSTRLFTHNVNLTYPERLGFDVGRLLSPNTELRFKRHDILLKSTDNCYIPAHKAILFARWPAIGKRLVNSDDTESYLPLNLCTTEIEMLLNYIYTGTLPSLTYSIAEKLLQIDAKIECPPYIVMKCKYLVYGIIG